ncbi:MAG: kynureninase [Phycisphaerae bacterium]|nr:kynureninase [Phycisphaerae bacterium]
MTTDLAARETEAIALDAEDSLRALRGEFHIPGAGAIRGLPDGDSCVYLTGNSLGCQPRAVRGLVERELEDWARLGVEGHLKGRDPWLSYHEQFRGPLSRLVGAGAHEVVAMNSLTVNLHLLMATFYRPTAARYRIVIEDSAFPSDSYAVASQAAMHGFDPGDAVVRLRPRAGEQGLRTEDVLAAIERGAGSIALVLLGAVNYLTGQWFDMAAITAGARSAGARVGWDLAHAIGNVPMRLHDWDADFAAWCSYKYLNAGPGAVAGAFVHERHCRDSSLPQLAGWWGNDPAARFRMASAFEPVPRADRWALSNPPILSLTPLKASLALFDRATLPALRAKSVRLTAYMESLVRGGCPGVSSLTPTDPAQRGCQLSLVVPGGRPTLERLTAEGIVADFREPDVIRAAPVPLYNSFHDVWRFAATLARILKD